MQFSNELTVIFAAVGAVIFLFAMDSYYRRLENRANEEQLEIEPVIESIETALPTEQESDENFAA